MNRGKDEAILADLQVDESIDDDAVDSIIGRREAMVSQEACRARQAVS